MFSRSIAAMLIILLAGQPVAAAADMHLQKGDDHQHTSHSHDNDSRPPTDGLLHGLVDALTDHEQTHDYGTGDTLDCQHCCQCHNGTQVLIDIVQHPVTVSLAAIRPARPAAADSLLHPPSLRPPII